MKKVLVTGGFGKIGSHFIKNFSERYEMRASDIHIEQNLFSSDVKILKSDVQDFKDCLHACEDIDTVVHLAGIIDETDSAFDKVFETNFKGTKNIIDAAIQQGCKRIIFASSAQTVENYPVDVQVKEEVILRPKNYYGVVKCFGEALLSYHAYQSDISGISLRIGAYEFPEDHNTMNARDLSAFTHPDDLNQLIDRCIQAEGIQYEVFNAISNNRYKRLDITRAFEKVGYNPSANAFEIYNIV